MSRMINMVVPSALKQRVPPRIRNLVLLYRKNALDPAATVLAAVLRGAIRLTRSLVPFRTGNRIVASLTEAMVGRGFSVVVKTPDAPTTFCCLGATQWLKRPGVDEDATLAWIHTLPDGAVLWDIGANVGRYAVPAGLSGLRVWAFEPAAANVFALMRNIELNGLDHRVTALNVAFHDRTGVGSLRMARTDIGSANHHYGEQRVATGSPVYYQAVLGYSIDDFIERFAPDFPEYIKLDVDGNEGLILDGARRTLGDSRLQAVIMEVRNETTEQVRTVMQQVGFLEPRQLRMRRSGIADVLFTRGTGPGASGDR